MKRNVINKKLPVRGFFRQPWVYKVALIVVTSMVALATDKGWAALSFVLSTVGEIITAISSAVPF